MFGIRIETVKVKFWQNTPQTPKTETVTDRNHAIMIYNMQ